MSLFSEMTSEEGDAFGTRIAKEIEMVLEDEGLDDCKSVTIVFDPDSGQTQMIATELDEDEANELLVKVAKGIERERAGLN